MLKRVLATMAFAGFIAVVAAPPLRAEPVTSFFGSRDSSLVYTWDEGSKRNGSAGNSGKRGASDIASGTDHTLRKSAGGGGVPVTIPEYDPLANNVPMSPFRAFLPECWDAGVELAECLPAEPGDPADAAPGGAPAPAPPTRAQVEAVVRTLVARLRLPDSVPQVGPDPSVNEWNMAVVGHPLWLWVDAPNRMDTSVSGYGVTIRMDARRSGLSFAMGDGSVVRCASTTPYDDTLEPGTPSSTCGHTYSKPSLPKGNYRVTATAHWVIDWSAVGYTGTIPLDVSDSRELPVGELQAVVVR